MNTYLAKINEFIDKLNSEVKEALEKVGMVREFKKNEFLLKPGNICRYSFLIENGIARKYYLKDNKEITTEIYFPEDIAVSLSSYILQKPGREFIQALENCTIFATDYRAFNQLKKSYPELTELDLMMIEYNAMWLEERLYQTISLDATERYLLLLKEQPRLIQHVQLTTIASYLGISLETLSRIRARI